MWVVMQTHSDNWVCFIGKPEDVAFFFHSLLLPFATLYFYTHALKAIKSSSTVCAFLVLK